MTKVILSIGYTKFVLDSDKALPVMDALANAEIYERKSVKNEALDKWESFHKITPQPSDRVGYVTVESITDTLYHGAKMAGGLVDD